MQVAAWRETNTSTFYKRLLFYQNSMPAGLRGCSRELKNKCSDCSTDLIGDVLQIDCYAKIKDQY
jgi:hypothetical protein